MRVRVRFFAGTRDAVGARERHVELVPGATLADLVARLEVDHPRLARYREHALLARNGEFVDARATLADGDEVALMPPVSGGALDEAPLSLDALVAEVETEGAGAVVTFTGLVRATSKEAPGARVARLEFEAHEAMAERALAGVRAEALAKFGLVDVALRHRVGALALGDGIVAVVVSARHRAEAFEAAAWIMDELKTRVPIWKREVDADGASRWVNDVKEEAGK